MHYIFSDYHGIIVHRNRVKAIPTLKLRSKPFMKGSENMYMHLCSPEVSMKKERCRFYEYLTETYDYFVSIRQHLCRHTGRLQEILLSKIITTHGLLVRKIFYWKILS